MIFHSWRMQQHDQFKWSWLRGHESAVYISPVCLWIQMQIKHLQAFSIKIYPSVTIVDYCAAVVESLWEHSALGLTLARDWCHAHCCLCLTVKVLSLRTTVLKDRISGVWYCIWTPGKSSDASSFLQWWCHCLLWMGWHPSAIWCHRQQPHINACVDTGGRASLESRLLLDAYRNISSSMLMWFKCAWHTYMLIPVPHCKTYGNEKC